MKYFALLSALTLILGGCVTMSKYQSAVAESKRATCRSSWPSCLNQRSKAPERLNFAKELVLEAPRFPLTCRGTLSPTSSPVARAASLRLYVLDAGFSCGTQIHSRIRRRQECLWLTLLLYQSADGRATPDYRFPAPGCGKARGAA